MKPPLTIEEYNRITRELAYSLLGDPVDYDHIMNLILPDGRRHVQDHTVRQIMDFLIDKAYIQRRRKLGPPAVLHHLKTCAIFSHASTIPSKLRTMDILTCLLHDLMEDFRGDEWKRISKDYNSALDGLNDKMRLELIVRLKSITRNETESYEDYLARLLDDAKNTPDLLLCKVADLTDNTLDLKLNEECLPDFYKMVFDLLYTKPLGSPHAKMHVLQQIDGAKRLLRLYKNFVFLDVLQKTRIRLGPMARKMVATLINVSIHEAQNIVTHIFLHHLRNCEKQREILMKTLNQAENSFELTGFVRTHFSASNSDNIERKLNDLYGKKELMVKTALALIILLSNFLQKLQCT